MESLSTSVRTFEFRVNPTGKDVVVSLKCVGIATGTYWLRFESAMDSAVREQEGNIEKPAQYRFAAGSGLRKVAVRIRAVPFSASDPGGYRVIVEQADGNRLETPELTHNVQVEISVQTG